MKLSILKISFHDSSASVKEKLQLFAKTLYPSCICSITRLPLLRVFSPFLHLSFCDEQNENGCVIMKNRYLKSGPER